MVSYSFDYEKEDSLRNWVEKFNLTCVPKSKIGMIGSAYFIGWLVALVFIPRLADLFGRKVLFRIGMVIQLSAYSTIMYSNSLNVLIGSLFVFGMCATARISVGFIYLMEFLPQNYHATTATVIFLAEACLSVIGAIYFTFVSNYWLWLVLGGWILQLYGTCTSFLIPESPKFLLKTGKMDEAFRVYGTIAKVNGTSHDMVALTE